jgi:hypothetical protein
MTGDDSLQNPEGEPSPGERRRTAPRHNLIATAEFVDQATQTRASARISEISLGGCYLDALNPLPADAIISLRIVRDTGTFETKARIAYTHPGFGMGATFLETDPAHKSLLEKWLAELEP